MKRSNWPDAPSERSIDWTTVAILVALVAAAALGAVQALHAG